MEVKNDNELIARFMGWRPSIDGDGWYAMNLAYYSVLLYDESWDWLMPVCSKLGMVVVDTDINTTYGKVVNRIMEINQGV